MIEIVEERPRAPASEGLVDPTWSAPQIRAEIQRLYQALQRIPALDRPSTTDQACSPAYVAIQTQIRALADRYRALGGEPGRKSESS